ncbi:S9 family peptidase [Microbacterium sp.]|uniref:S9 family peptidase n=1 Tax=Microbacterium sp. TaxID=51671 RepID=UPI002E31FBD7|nr:S9 family peptidase [Microbacterium sp.]HEX5728691.1 S9 family peptidase [Microbacterium sp.]
MRPADIEKLVSVGRPDIAPDGSFAVFATSRPDLEANRAVGQLWRVDLPDGALRRLTRGTADAAPQLSPDGSQIAFLRRDAKDKPQLHVVSSGGGEPVQGTDTPLGVESFDWSADGASLAYTARIPETGRYGTVDGLDAAAEAPRRITGIRWHANGIGYVADRPAQLFVVPAPDLDAEPFYEPAAAVRPESATPPKKKVVAADAIALTEGVASHSNAVFLGDEVLTVVDEIEPDRRDLRSRLVAVRVDGSGERELVGRGADLSIVDVAVAPDGAVGLLASDVGPSGVDFVASGVALWLLAEGDAPRRLTDGDTTDFGEVGSHITAVGDDFLVQDRYRGRVRLVRVTRTGDVRELIGGDVEVTGHAAAGEQIVASLATADSVGELVLAGEDSSRTLTSFGDDVGRVRPLELTISGRDGYPIHGWVAQPDGEGPFPVILQIHGGPHASYGIHLFDETQVLVSAGYAVVYSNPRGSAGYGRGHGRSIRGAMGTVDMADVLDFLDGALARDARLDSQRVGIMGGSYGGYLTAWVIAHDHRFSGAIVERGYLDPVSFQGTSDIGSFFGDEYVGTDPEAIARQSPMAVVSQVTTPTLVIHSELDFRCPLEQATRYYAALKRQGTDAELFIFPGENHELTRSGQPRHRIERFDAVLEWWKRWLPAA